MVIKNGDTTIGLNNYFQIQRREADIRVTSQGMRYTIQTDDPAATYDAINVALAKGQDYIDLNAVPKAKRAPKAKKETEASDPPAEAPVKEPATSE